MSAIDNILKAVNNQGKILSEHDALISDIFDILHGLHNLLKWHLVLMIVFLIWCICDSVYTCWKKSKNEKDEKEYALLGGDPVK